MTIKQSILPFVVLFLILLYRCEAFSSININPQLYKTKLAKFTLFELKVAVYNDISSKHTQRHEIKTQYKLEVCLILIYFDVNNFIQFISLLLYLIESKSKRN